jgi:MFS superfamily sulfate permease-like transporter
MSGVGLIIILLQLFPLWTQFGKINLRNIRGCPTFSNLIFMRLALGILTVLIYYLNYSLKAIPSALALIIGALTAIFWDGMCPLEKFHLEFQIQMESIQLYQSIHLNSRICRRAGRAG